MNVCVCVCVCSESNHMADIAQSVQTKLDAFKADKRDLGTVC